MMLLKMNELTKKLQLKKFPQSSRNSDLEGLNAKLGKPPGNVCNVHGFFAMKMNGKYCG